AADVQDDASDSRDDRRHRPDQDALRASSCPPPAGQPGRFRPAGQACQLIWGRGQMGKKQDMASKQEATNQQNHRPQAEPEVVDSRSSSTTGQGPGPEPSAAIDAESSAARDEAQANFARYQRL